jgi:hypothetical protein
MLGAPRSPQEMRVCIAECTHVEICNQKCLSIITNTITIITTITNATTSSVIIINTITQATYSTPTKVCVV